MRRRVGKRKEDLDRCALSGSHLKSVEELCEAKTAVAAPEYFMKFDVVTIGSWTSSPFIENASKTVPSSK